MAKSSLKIVKNSGNPLSKIKMNPETKMFICETCQDNDIKEKADFQFSMKFELVNHFLNFHMTKMVVLQLIKHLKFANGV